MSFNFFLSILSGVLGGLSFDFPKVSFLVWFSFSFLFYILFTSRRPCRYFFLSGVVFYSIVIFWLGFVTRLGTFLLVLYLSFYWVVFSFLGKRTPKKYAIVILPFLWVGLEFIRENIPAFGFGWAILGYSQFNNLYLIQTADILGAKLISFIIVTFNVIIAISWKRKKVNLSHLLYALFIAAFSFVYSFYKINTYRPEEFVKVTVVQPNIPQSLKWKKEARPFIIKRLLNLGIKTEKESLVVYPEASWPFLLDMDDREDFINWAKEVKRDIIIGAVIREKERFYNAAILLDKRGVIKGIYRKIILVPFGEYVPLRRFLNFVSVFNSLGDISAGKKEVLFDYRNIKFSVLICFEDVFGTLVSSVSYDSNFLISITNDAWFGGNPEAMQHFSIMTLRAIENRISIVRCANTGISGYVDGVGRGHYLENSFSTVFFQKQQMFHVPLKKERTLYRRIGDWVFVVGFVLSLFYLYIVKRGHEG